MALEVYFKDDIAQGILAVTIAMLSAAVAHGGTNTEYVRGILDTARAQALNYGISWSKILAEMRNMMAYEERNDLLDLVAKTLPIGKG